MYRGVLSAVVFLLPALLCLCSCSVDSGSDHARAYTAAYPLAAVNDWAYVLQLEGDDNEPYIWPAVTASNYDLLVLDAFHENESFDQIPLSTSSIRILKNTPGHERIVLAYVSIGEAEDYRYYWEEEWDSNPPDWIEGENPLYPGNYLTYFYDFRWRDILMNDVEGFERGYIDRILDAGFDGVFLDKVDAYEDLGYDVDSVIADEMRKLVIDIARYARRRNRNFLVFVQNVPELAVGEAGAEYFDEIDGIAVEDTWFNDGEPVEQAHRDRILPILDQMRSLGKTVLCVDYFDPDMENLRNLTDMFFLYCQSHEFVPYAALSRDLDSLYDTNHQPD